MADHRIRKRLHAMILREGSQRAVAQSLGISEAYLSDILREKRAPGRKVLLALALTRQPHRHEAV